MGLVIEWLLSVSVKADFQSVEAFKQGEILLFVSENVTLKLNET